MSRVTRWFVKWPATPDTWLVAFGKDPQTVQRVLTEAGYSMRPEPPWHIAWSHKPKWFADESHMKRKRGWRRKYSKHLGSGVRITTVCGMVPRSDKP